MSYVLHPLFSSPHKDRRTIHAGTIQLRTHILLLPRGTTIHAILLPCQRGERNPSCPGIRESFLDIIRNARDGHRYIRERFAHLLWRYPSEARVVHLRTSLVRRAHVGPVGAS